MFYLPFIFVRQNEKAQDWESEEVTRNLTNLLPTFVVQAVSQPHSPLAKWWNSYPHRALMKIK